MMGKKKNLIFYLKILTLFLLLSVITVEAQSIFKHPPQIVFGRLEYAGFSSISVDGKNYDISEAKIFNEQGNLIPKHYLKQGQQVELTIEDGIVTQIKINFKDKGE